VTCRGRGYDVPQLNDGFHDLQQTLTLDYLFIDTEPGVNEETLLSIAISDTLVIVLRTDHQDDQAAALPAVACSRSSIELTRSPRPCTGSWRGARRRRESGGECVHAS